MMHLQPLTPYPINPLMPKATIVALSTCGTSQIINRACFEL